MSGQKKSPREVLQFAAGASVAAQKELEQVRIALENEIMAMKFINLCVHVSFCSFVYIFICW